MNFRYDFVLSTVKKAGDILIKASQNKLEINLKDNDVQDIVTNADIEINNFLTDEIKNNFPNETIYSEEDSAVDVSKGTFWSIDPIDGTSSFSRNIPHFAVVLTFVEKGIPTIGAVFNPKTKELFSFEKGQGAFLNGQTVRVSKITELPLAYTFIRIGRDKENWPWGLAAYKFLLENANKTYSFGSSSLDFCFVGVGRIEACIYGTLTTINVAGALGFVREAGGLVIDEKGQEINSLSKEKQIVVAINNQKLLSELKKGIILAKN